MPSNLKVSRSSSWAMVDNLDALGSVNWSKVIFDNLHASFAKLKNLKDAPGKVQHFFSGFAPIFEAIVFSRIQSLVPMPDLAFIHPPIQSYKSKRIGWRLLKTIEALEITACPWCEHGVEVDTVVDGISTNAMVDDISASDVVVDDSSINAVVDDISASGEQDCSVDDNLASVTKEGYDKLVLDVVSLSIGDASASAVPPPKKKIQEPRRKSERIKRRPAKLDL
ncbi:hypothetical protein KIW84_015622 [Lathyrus oleraceus]|uniref:Uncharacterized protein n=1 Tax=Pisum sativum TaxID=3888 RepID=A0A9D5H0T6_PEA|nr:hypothetical protein KIW84_015617 [Pisum sativum]KAI5448263.1 hypothetical protein KIW84_015622 [Pisum sativum]